MANIYIEKKGRRCSGFRVSAACAVTGYSRGPGCDYGADEYHAVLIMALAASAVGILEEDAINVTIHAG